MLDVLKVLQVGYDIIGYLTPPEVVLVPVRIVDSS
jgi:hypothetical protein